MTGTLFTSVYNRFLEKITDDMYVEFTIEDTIKDLQNLLIDSIPGFEFPRKNLYDYTIETKVVKQNETESGDFIIGILWEELQDENQIPDVIIEHSSFSALLDSEEINILALLMKQAWIQRQVASIENTRLKYTGSDFKMTSQANHLAKLLNLLEEAQRESFHMQRLYKRRKLSDKDGTYKSTWSMFK